MLPSVFEFNVVYHILTQWLFAHPQAVPPSTFEERSFCRVPGMRRCGQESVQQAIEAIQQAVLAGVNHSHRPYHLPLPIHLRVGAADSARLLPLLLWCPSALCVCVGARQSLSGVVCRLLSEGADAEADGDGGREVVEGSTAPSAPSHAAPAASHETAVGLTCLCVHHSLPPPLLCGVLEVRCTASPTISPTAVSGFTEKANSRRRGKQVKAAYAALARGLEQLQLLRHDAPPHSSPLTLHIRIELDTAEDAQLEQLSFHHRPVEAERAREPSAAPVVASVDTAVHLITVGLGASVRGANGSVSPITPSVVPSAGDAQLSRFRRFLLDEGCPPISRIREEWTDQQQTQGQ